MTWKYINPGDYRLLDNYTAASVGTYLDSVIAPVTHMAFYSSIYTNQAIIIPSGTKEVWLLATLISESGSTNTGNAGTILFTTPSQSSYKRVMLCVTRALTYLSINGSQKYRLTLSEKRHLRIVRVFLHIKSHISDGAVDLYLDGKQVFSESGINVMGGEDIELYGLYFHRDYYDYCSDLIISDEPIDKDEHVAVLPIANTSADGWTYDAVNNIYTADSAGKSIWQVPDINQLKAVTGLDNPSVTSVALQAYNVSTNDTSQVDTLQKSVKQNGQIVITDSADISSATAVISPAMTINPVTNAAWTLNDLANIQLGITTAKSA